MPFIVRRAFLAEDYMSEERAGALMGCFGILFNPTEIRTIR